MADKTAISWTRYTWNPWRGCTKISPGCKNCYMFTAQAKQQTRTGDHTKWDPNIVQRTTTWKDPYRWQKLAAASAQVESVFTCSWSDFFHEAADDWRPGAWRIIRECPNLIFQILTKRPERIANHLPPDWGPGYPNVWLGTSVENQNYADNRIPILLGIPAAVHFLSVEPMLGPIILPKLYLCAACGQSFDRNRTRKALTNICPHCDSEGEDHRRLNNVDWVIVGGESGPGYRPMELDWARSIRDQCLATKTAFFFKQSAAPRTEMGTTLDGQICKQYPPQYYAYLESMKASKKV